jgi:hypothetical protein
MALDMGGGEFQPFDRTTVRAALAGPGMDTRAWVGFGLVAAETDQQKSVYFQDDNGGALPFPVVLVQLMPSRQTVPCRVASSIAGTGEGEWTPFVAGDEVIVAIVDGDERSGCTIIGRLNQSLDTFPSLVAGMDPTQNSIAFRRLRTPFVFETQNAWMVHNATTNSFLGIDQTGQVTAANGDQHALHVGHDFCGILLGDNSATVQLLPADSTFNSRAFLQANALQLMLDDTAASLLTPGTVTFTTSGGGYQNGHAITTEQAVALIFGVLTAVGTVIPGPLVGAAFSAAVTGFLSTGIPLASVATIAPFEALLAAAFASFLPDPTGLKPGIGTPGFLI